MCYKLIIIYSQLYRFYKIASDPFKEDYQSGYNYNLIKCGRLQNVPFRFSDQIIKSYHMEDNSGTFTPRHTEEF